MINLIRFICLILILPVICFADNVVVRAALDIGSGATKLKVAEVNLDTNKIEKVLVNQSFPVQYQEELEKSQDGTFNESVMQTGIDALKKSKEIALQNKADKVVAVATASFRKAKNVEAFVERIYKETGVKVYIIDQNLEGILGFQATAAKVDTDPANIVVWDIGGGSYQFTMLDEKGELKVARGLDASIPFKNHVIKEIKLEDPNVITTPNPMTIGQIYAANSHARKVSQKIDTVFQNKIAKSGTKVVGIGNIFAYGIYPLVEKKSTFSQRDLFVKVQKLQGKKDQQLGKDAYVNVAATNPVLVLGFMQTLGIEKMDIIDINNSDGALLYPNFWQEKG